MMSQTLRFFDHGKHVCYGINASPGLWTVIWRVHFRVERGTGHGGKGMSWFVASWERSRDKSECGGRGATGRWDDDQLELG